MLEEPLDARSTPGWLRVPGLFLLLAQLTIFGLGLVYAHGVVAHTAPRWIMKVESIAYFGNWKMFTLVDKKQRDMDGYALYGDVWEPIDLPALFPARWESGPRYARKTIRRSGRHLSVLASATCGRLERTPERVKLVDIRWRSKLGQREQPRTGKVRETKLIEWQCERRPASVKGRPI